MSQTILFFGASRGCSFYAVFYVIAHTSKTCVVFLRKPKEFKETPEYKALDEESKKRVVIVSGDASSVTDVANAFQVAGDQCRTVVYSIGAPPSTGRMGMPKLQWKKGIEFVFAFPHVCEDTMSNILKVIGALHKADGRKYSIVALSTMGLGEGQKNLPGDLKLLWKMIEIPHHDKEALEILLCHSAGISTPREYPERKALLAPKLSALPTGTIDVMIIQPAVLKDGEKGLDKVKELEDENGAYAITRKDVGSWIGKVVSTTEDDLKQNRWFGKSVVLSS